MRAVIFLSLVISAFSSNLDDLLQKTDLFFDSPRNAVEVEEFEKNILDDLSTVRKKRSVSDLFPKEQVRVLQGTSSVTYVTYNSPSDLNGFELNGKIYAVSIQSKMPDGGKSEKPLLALYKIEKETSRLMAEVMLDADGAIEVHPIKDNVLIVVSHRGSEKEHQGCSIFRIISDSLSRTQHLDTGIPIDVKLATNLQKVYMAVSTRERVQIFEWKGLHFDQLQELAFESVSALSFFTIDNILFLAAAHDSETSSCAIWEQSIENGLFECRQYLDPKPAKSINHFRFKGKSSSEEEHFLIISYKNDSSVIYKQDGQIFQPFQRISDADTVEWFPFEESESFVLFQITNKVTPFAYDGWRFVKLDANINHDSLRYGCKKLRSLRRSNETWLIGINTGIEMAAMMRLSFETQPSMSDSTMELNNWCQSHQIDEGAVEELEKKLLALPSSQDDLRIKQKMNFKHLKVDNLKARKFSGFDEELVFSINKAAALLDDLDQILNDVESLSLASFSTYTIQGPISKDQLILECGKNSPCKTPDLTTNYLNKKRAPEFLDNIVDISSGIELPVFLQFEHLRTENASSLYFNNHLGSDLLSGKDDVLFKNGLFVNGTVNFHGNVFVGGEIDGVRLDREHAVLIDEDQNLAGDLIIQSGKFSNLTLKTLNGAPLEEFSSQQNLTTKIWENLSILNLTVHGRISGHPVWNLLNPGDKTEAEDVFVKDGKISGVDISDLVRIDKGDYTLKSDVTFQEPAFVENLQISDSINQIPLSFLLQLASGQFRDSNESEPLILRNVIGDEIIVKGTAKINDIVHADGSSLNKFIEDDEEMMTCVDGKSASSIHLCDNAGCNSYKMDSALEIDSLVVNSLKITGNINGLNWVEFLNDAVFEGENVTVYGKKTIEGVLNVTQLEINNQTSSHFFNPLNNLEIIDGLVVENLYLNGLSLSEQDDSLIVENVNFENGVNVTTVNEIDLEEFLKNVAFINQSANLGVVDFLQTVQVENLTNYNTLNNASFTDSVVLKNSTRAQNIERHWTFKQNVVIDGELIVHGKTNGMDLEVLCEMSRNDPRVIVGGSVQSPDEPKITNSTNNLKLVDLLDDIWLKNEPIVFENDVTFSKVTIEGNVTLLGNLNGIELENLARGYLSKSIPRRMLAPIRIRNLTSLGIVRATNITGKINGLNLKEFAPNVLQYGIDQTFDGQPQFHQLVISKLDENCTINNLNLRTDVLRYSTEAQVTGLKTITEIETKKMTILAGKMLQGVDFQTWIKEVVAKDSGVINGDVFFPNAEVLENLLVSGTVGGVKFDKQHLLTIDGNQTITGKKRFVGDLFINSMHSNGLVNGVNLSNLLTNGAFLDSDVNFSASIQLQNIKTGNLEVTGELDGVNVTDFCSSVQNRVDIDYLGKNYTNLLATASQVYDNLADGAYFLDHYELVQKFNKNVSAIASIPQTNGSQIAVFRKLTKNNNNVTMMVWNDFEKIYKIDKPHSIITGNTSMITFGQSYLLVETWKQGGVLFYENLQLSLNISQATCATPFILPNKTCVFMGQANQTDSIMCAQNGEKMMETVQIFNATHCKQATNLKIINETWLAVIGAKVSRPSTELYVTVFSKTNEQDIFIPRQDLPVLHPVSVSATTHGRYSYLVVASQHQPESVRSSLLSVFRYAKPSHKWTRYQEITVEAPRFVYLEHLPTGQLALYVLTDNPARAFLVYLYRGVEGFVEETKGLAVHAGKILLPFNFRDNHFVAIAGDRYSQLLQAHFFGSR